MNLEIGLLDFQSAKGSSNNHFPIHPNNSGLVTHSDFSNFNVGQSSNFHHKESQNSTQSFSRAPHQTSKSSWNLDELMTDLALVYVSGHTDSVEGDTLQFCTSSCCNSRVKYARVCREEKETSPWDREIISSTWDIQRQVPTRDMLSGWDLGSDGASTPGSGTGYNCWSTQDSLGVVGAGRHPWAGTEFGTIQPSQDYREYGLLENHYFEDPEKFDSWGGCEVMGQVEEQGEAQENKWNRIKRKTKKTVTVKAGSATK